MFTSQRHVRIPLVCAVGVHGRIHACLIEGLPHNTVYRNRNGTGFTVGRLGARVNRKLGKRDRVDELTLAVLPFADGVSHIQGREKSIDVQFSQHKIEAKDIEAVRRHYISHEVRDYKYGCEQAGRDRHGYKLVDKPVGPPEARPVLAEPEREASGDTHICGHSDSQPRYARLPLAIGVQQVGCEETADGIDQVHCKMGYGEDGAYSSGEYALAHYISRVGKQGSFPL